MSINVLKMKNLRCFSKEKSSIRPITIVVGENNTGKTTFLSVYKLMHDLLYENKPITPSSIEDLLKGETYKYLGGSKNIIRRPNNTDIVNIGATLKVGEQDVWDVEYSIKNGKSCEKILIQCFEDKIEINIKGSMLNILVNEQEGYNSTMPLDFYINFFKSISNLPDLSDKMKNVIEKNRMLSSKIATVKKSFKEGENLKTIFCNLLEPIHLKPKDQYNPTKIKTTDPSYVLCKMAKMKRNNNWTKISEELKRFGENARLFQSLDMNLLKKDDDDTPFSIVVKVDGLESNITNVGYGVSQFLPVLGNILISDREKSNTFLIQQPETHLHPRVEAEFTSLMVNMINEKDKKYKFICETHSDYIIQRATIEIKEKNLKPEDFLILYFELKNGEAKIHPITIDSNGNFEGQPDSYQAFFLSEDYKLLGLED